MSSETNSRTPELPDVSWHPEPTQVQARDREPPFLVLKALVGLFAFDALGFGRNFARMHRFVTTYKIFQRAPSVQVVDQVARAVDHARAWYPKRVLCLQRSAVTTCLLRRCGVPAKMVIGAQNLPFKAHAWTEVNGRAINERRDVQRLYAIWERY
jgi:Transglutaminase-like superfamily